MLTYDIVNASLLQANEAATEAVLQIVEECMERFELTISQKTTLSTFRGSIHYQLKRG